MKVKVLITEEELKLMGVTKEQLGQIALSQIQGSDVKGVKITDQTEVEVETILDSEIEQKWSQYTYPSLMTNNLENK